MASFLSRKNQTPYQLLILAPILLLACNGKHGPLSPQTDERSFASILINRSGDGSAARAEGGNPNSITSSFRAVEQRDASFNFTLGPKSVMTDFALEDVLAPTKDTYNQITRALVTKSFTQGNAGTSKKQTFDQMLLYGLVDILVVVDNSGSMREEQVKLSTKLNELLVQIQKADWRVGVISTTPAVPAGINPNSSGSAGSELCNTAIIRAGEADAASKFAQAVTAGTSGSGNEQGIRQAVVGLRCSEKPWVRPGSTLAVLIVSDEDNCSLDGSDCSGLPWAKESYLTNYVESTLKRSIGKDAGFYGIVAPSLAACPTALNPATQYLRLFAYKANGVVNYSNICDADYKGTLNRISSSIAKMLDSKFELAADPDAGTLKLTLQMADGSLKPIDPNSYTLTGRVIAFMPGKEPALGSKIIAEYTVGAKPILKNFTLDQDPAAGTLVCKVNGNIVAPGTAYTLNGRVISFVQAPADMALITADYRENVPLQDRFKTSAPAVPGTVKVSVNGQPSNDFTFDEAASEIQLKKVPADGLPIEISYGVSQGPKLTYNLPLAKEAFNVKILEKNMLVPFTQNGNDFTIDATVHKRGKVLTLNYEAPDSGVRTFELGRTPVANTAEVKSSQTTSCAIGQGLELVDGRLVSTCALSSNVEFTLNYKYQERVSTFVVKDVKNPERGTWVVTVNGEETTDYTRQGSSFTLNFDPGNNARIDIIYTPPD